MTPTASGAGGPANTSANINAAPSANTDAAPGVAGAAETATDASGDAGGGMDLVADVTDEAIIANMSPTVLAEASAAIAGEQDFTPESLEQDMRTEVEGEGATIAGLASLLGGAWNWILEGAGKVGGKAAGWFMEFLALPNYQLGNKLGWLTGMILLELLIAYFTAGGYLVIKEGAGIGARLLAYFVRYLDMGGAILGVMGKGLGRLRGPIMGGLDAAGGFLSRFKFLQGIMGRVRGAADWLFRFGDEIGAAADLARKGPIDGAAGRRTAELGDEAAGGAQRVLDGPAPPARTPDAPTRAPDAPTAHKPDVPGDGTVARESAEGASARGPAQLDEAADGSRRTLDDPANPRVKDDALAATEKPQAVALAKGIAEANDRTNQQIPVVMGALMALKAQYRWIDYFVVRPKSGRGIYEIGMVASPETEIDNNYSVYESPAAPPPRGADPDGWRVPPQGGTVIEEGDHFMIYAMPDGSKRIRFDARQARTSGQANPGRNMTREARAGVSPDGKPYVWEGRHRSAGAAQGGHIPEGAGGIDGHPEMLDFDFAGHGAPTSGPHVRDVKIDEAAEMGPGTLRDYDEARDLRFGDPDARALKGHDRELMDPARGREIADDIVGDAVNSAPARVTPEPNGNLRAATDGHPPPSNLAAKNGQLSAAITAAHAIVVLNDPPNTPVPIILGFLLGLKTHYRWINTFEAKMLGGGRVQFFMIASKISIGTADLDDDVPGLPSGRAPDGATAGPPAAPTRASDAPPARDVNAPPARDADPAPTQAADEVIPATPKTVAHTHRAGNRQVIADGNRWNVPPGRSVDDIPATDRLGDELQAMTDTAAAQWNPRRNLSENERRAISAAHAAGEHWRANLLTAQAKGRWVETQVRDKADLAGLGISFSRKGLDVVDPSTGIGYDIMSGTASNIDRHAMREAGELFRMITF